jgi:hypothetical protein
VVGPLDSSSSWRLHAETHNERATAAANVKFLIISDSKLARGRCRMPVPHGTPPA